MALCRRLVTRAHPRRCGEHPHPRLLCGDSRGSSPQVRGTSGGFGVHERQHGLIPAGAGNMPSRRASAGASRAHPRRCGEHCEGSIAGRFTQGSSPQVRGTFEVGDQPIQGVGLIPAGAGNISSIAFLGLRIPAHPRRCGEHHLAEFRSEQAQGSSPQVRGTSGSPGLGERGMGGSSPQVRGTSNARNRAGPLERLIPAGAGNI